MHSLRTRQLNLEMDLWSEEARQDRFHQKIFCCLPECTKKRLQTPRQLKQE